jgi:hypothetical protein
MGGFGAGRSTETTAGCRVGMSRIVADIVFSI